MTLQDLPTDILVNVFSLLSIPDILNFRQTSQQLFSLSKEPIVWINARNRQILSNNWPYDSSRNDEDPELLEKATRNAWRLGCRWSSSHAMGVRKSKKFATDASTAISDIRFFDTRSRRMLLTVSKGIWSILTLWVIDDHDNKEPSKVSEWSSRGGLFTGLAINEDVDADERIAVSVSQDGNHETLLLAIDTVDEEFTMTPKRRIPTPKGAGALRALMFSGSLLALSDDTSHTTIFDRTTGQTVLLVEYPDEESEGNAVGNWKHNTPVKVLFLHHSIFVVRARSLSLFPRPSFTSAPTSTGVTGVAHGHSGAVADDETTRADAPVPICTPIASHSFGWVDGIDVVATQSPSHDLKVFVRGESDNPWRSDEGSIDVYLLVANSDVYTTSPTSPSVEAFPQTTPSSIPPYTFPPYPISALPTPRGSIRCTTLRAGPCGTALWICPPSRSTLDASVTGAGLVVDQWAVDGIADAGLDLSGVGAPPGSGSPGVSDTGLVDLNGLDIDIYGTGVGVSTNHHRSLPSKRPESIMAGVFPGPLLSSSATPSSLGQPKLKPVLLNTGPTGCTALDYDEASGRVCMGLGDGSVWVGWL